MIIGRRLGSRIKMKRCTRSGCGTCVGYVLSALAGSLVVLVGASVPTLEELSSGLFDSISFNVSHVTVDSATGRLYVGAVNRLYELSPALDALRHVVTGPYPDNPMCPPPPKPCRCTVISCGSGTERLPIDAVTKTLLIDYNARQLIHCTNLFQVKHQLHYFDLSGALKTREWTTRHEMTRVDKAGVETRDRLI